MILLGDHPCRPKSIEGSPAIIESLYPPVPPGNEDRMGQVYPSPPTEDDVPYMKMFLRLASGRPQLFHRAIGMRSALREAFPSITYRWVPRNQAEDHERSKLMAICSAGK